MDFQINNEIFCYGYGYQWHLLIATPPMVVFYWYDDDIKEIKNNTLNYKLSFKLTMITRTLLVTHYPVFDYIFSKRGKVKYHLLHIFFLWTNDCCLSLIPINYFPPSQHYHHPSRYDETFRYSKLMVMDNNKLPFVTIGSIDCRSFSKNPSPEKKV